MSYVASSGATTAGGTSLAPAEPAGLGGNDIMIACANFNAAPGTVTPPTGWTLITSHTSGTPKSYWYWARRSEVGAGPYTWSWTTSTAASVGITAHSGRATSGTPYTNTDGVGYGVAYDALVQSTHASPSITPDTSNTELVNICSHISSSTTINSIADYGTGDPWGLGFNNTAGARARSAHHAHVSGATPASVWTLGANRVALVFVVALKEAGGAAPAPPTRALLGVGR